MIPNTIGLAIRFFVPIAAFIHLAGLMVNRAQVADGRALKPDRIQHQLLILVIEQNASKYEPMLTSLRVGGVGLAVSSAVGFTGARLTPKPRSHDYFDAI